MEVREIRNQKLGSQTAAKHEEFYKHVVSIDTWGISINNMHLELEGSLYSFYF
jgi:hypothetical protein